jgi:hypothetical protein
MIPSMIWGSSGRACIEATIAVRSTRTKEHHDAFTVAVAHQKQPRNVGPRDRRITAASAAAGGSDATTRAIKRAWSAPIRIDHGGIRSLKL